MDAQFRKDALMVTEAANKASEGFKNYFDLRVRQAFHDSLHQPISDYENITEPSEFEAWYKEWVGGHPNHQSEGSNQDSVLFNDKQISDYEDSSEPLDFETFYNEWLGGNPNHQSDGTDQDDVLVNDKERRRKIAAKKKKDVKNHDGSDQDDVLVNDKERRRKLAAKKKKDVKKHDQHKVCRAQTGRERPSSEKIPHSQLDDSVIDLSIDTQGYIEALQQQGLTQRPTQEAYRMYFLDKNILEEYALVIHDDIFQLPIADRFISWNALTAWVRAKSDSDEKLNDFNIRRFVSYIFAKLSFVKPDENTSNAKHYLIAARMSSNFVVRALQSFTNKKFRDMDKNFRTRLKYGGMGRLKKHGPQAFEGSDLIHTELQLLYPSEKQHLVGTAIKRREVIFVYSYYIPCQGNDDNSVNDCATSMAEFFFEKRKYAPLVVVGYSKVWGNTDAEEAKKMLNSVEITVIRR